MQTTISEEKIETRGKKRTFPNAEALMNRFREYLDHCREIDYLPNIAGFCAFCDIHRDTYYDQKAFYLDTIKKIEQLLEDAAINSKAVNDTFKIFYMKNKFSEDYKDRQEFMVTERNYEVEG